MIRIYRYKTIKGGSDEMIVNKISAHIPTPTDADYKKGYITRYFVQSANDPSAYVYEVDKDEYKNLVINPYYINVKLNWRIIGSSEEVKESNFKAVKFASKTLKSIIFYLPYYLQFYKG
jgi:hypothetical protein